MYQAMLISVNRKQEKNWIEAGMATPVPAPLQQYFALWSFNHLCAVEIRDLPMGILETDAFGGD
jgi:hypothetical protein